jgi:hypothetical protein
MLIESTGNLTDRSTSLDGRLHDIAWGLLILVTGLTWLFPEDRIPQGGWLLAVAAILLGVNVVRYFSHIRMNGLSLALGCMALLAALSRLWRTDLPLLAICFIIIGVSLLVKPLLTRTT